MPIHISTLLQYYKRPEIQEAIIACAPDREIAVRFGDKGFGKRPDTVAYPNDIIELAKQGATSFHASEELWKNPLQLNTGLRREELDDMRKGWDLVLDIDCPVLEYSKVGSHLIVKALQHHGIGSISVKFSGNHGFHIGIPFDSFPEKVQIADPASKQVEEKETRLLFPEGPRRIALYIKEMIRKKLTEDLLQRYDINDMVKSVGKKFKDVVKQNQVDPFEVLDIDTILISSRHMYRMAYSFNEKSGLVSIPIDPGRILDFDKEDAQPERVSVSSYKFLDKEGIEKGEAKKLILQAFDHKIKAIEEEDRAGASGFSGRHGERQKYDIPDIALEEKYFPPCITSILSGLEDGKKRSMFILTNFLVNVGWDHEKIEELLLEWNKKNKEPLRDNLIISHVRYHKQKKKAVLPPNCSNKMYYKDLRVCKPDNLCSKISNPVNYSRRKTRFLKREQKEEKEKNKSEEGDRKDQAIQSKAKKKQSKTD
ncbi:hypothetical protein GF351_00730 [Candidatus Woesearchaeota archaeon]|nr:hypothetical protein [Candidatus Woesearchaeota archaeon]